MRSWRRVISVVVIAIVAGLAWVLFPLTINAQPVTTVAGGTQGFLDGTGTDARFNFPVGVAVQGDSLFVADIDNHRIRVIKLSTQEVTTVQEWPAASTCTASSAAAGT